MGINIEQKVKNGTCILHTVFLKFYTQYIYGGNENGSL